MGTSDTPADEHNTRFAGVSRLYGLSTQSQLLQAHMVVVGLGGVGSWVAEALVRTGIGTLTLIEPDEICRSNTNRQSHATESVVGKAKIEVIAARLKDINPHVHLNLVGDFLDLKNITHVIQPMHDVVIDAIDAAHVKAGLAAYCSARSIRLVMVGSSGGKQDPSKVKTADLSKTESDRLLAKVRNHLYRHHNFERRTQGRKFRVDAVFSTEAMKYPKPDGSVCMEKTIMQDGVKLDCAGGFGSSMMVTSTFGMNAAATAVRRYLSKYS